MEKLLDNVIFDFPFLDYKIKNIPIHNKIQIGHPENPGASCMMDGLNIGENKYDSAYIICDNYYYDEGHSQNFSEDFEKRYNMKIEVINFVKNKIDDIIFEIENNHHNIFLKIDITGKKIYDILNKLDREKYIQIVCSEIIIPEKTSEINTFNNYTGLDITHNLIQELNIDSNLLNVKSYHCLIHLMPRWSLEEENWYSKNKIDPPPKITTTFLSSSFSKYIKILDIGDSDYPQKKVNIDTENIANIFFQNENIIYPDKFSYNNDNTDKSLIISRIDKTRMGWGQNLKGISNIQLFPKFFTGVFIRKDILDYLKISQKINNIYPSSLNIHLESFNTQEKFTDSLHKLDDNFSYWEPINIEGYKNLLIEMIKENSEINRLIIQPDYDSSSKSEYIESFKKNQIRIIMPSNNSIIKIFKIFFKKIDKVDILRKKSLKTIFLSLNHKNKKMFEHFLLKLLLSHIFITKSNNNSKTLSGYKVERQKNILQLKINEKVMNIKKIISMGNIYFLLTDNFVDINFQLSEKYLVNLLKIKKIISQDMVEYLINKFKLYKVIPEILKIYSEML